MNLVNNVYNYDYTFKAFSDESHALTKKYSGEKN